MNAPIRRVSTLVALLFASLLVSTTLIQFVFAKELNARPDNRRTLLASYSRERGQIIVGEKAVAKSVPTTDEFKFLRTYPDARDYAHITGYYSFYGAGGGLESAEADLLSGASDRLFYRRVSDLFTGRKPQGATLSLTIDPKVQKAAVDALDGRRGAAVAIEPKTGAILAMVSNPTYDPNTLASHNLKSVDTAYATLTKAQGQPLLNRAISQLYPPGSTFKVVTSAAALSSGDFTPESDLPGPGSLDLPQTTANLPNHGGQPCGSNNRTTLLRALETSCNTAFGWLGMELGAEAMREQSARFGIGDQLSVPMSVATSRVPEDPNPPQLAQSAIGQFDVRMTPLQMAMVAAGIANDGVVMRPYLVGSVLFSDLSVIDKAPQDKLSEAVTPEVAADLTTMMRAVVDSGTGTAAQIPGVEVAGKTGTAEWAPGRSPHAWFISFAPANDPKIAVAVIVEGGAQSGSESSGGRVAAPVAQRMMQAAIAR